MKNPCIELSFQATRVARCAEPPDPAEWLLCFEPPRDDGLDATHDMPLSAIRIAGVPPSEVRWVQVSCLERTVFEIDSHQGRSGHCSAAGEIVQAVAGMSGRFGMFIGGCDCQPPLTLRGAAVHLRLRSESAGGVTVRGLLC